MDIPEDLIPIILESNDHWWDRDLCRLALVSPCWLHYIRRRLYASPSLYSFTACASLARTLESNVGLASLVQHLSLRPICAGTSRSTSKGRMEIRTLLALDGLRSLTLGGDLAIRSERFLGFVTAADTLERLHIDGTLLEASLTSRASLEWSEDLFFRLPNLKSLELTNLEFEILSPTPEPLQLDELTLDTVSMIHGFLVQLIPEGSTLGKLCVKAHVAWEYDLDISTILYSSSVGSLIHEVLKPSLPFSDRPESFLEPSENVVNPCPLSLHYMELRGLHVDDGVLNSVRQRCPEVEELIISSRFISLLPEDWAMFLTSGALPALRRLTLTPGTNHPPYQHWNADGVERLVNAASKRRIDIRL